MNDAQQICKPTLIFTPVLVSTGISRPQGPCVMDCHNKMYSFILKQRKDEL